MWPNKDRSLPPHAYQIQSMQWSAVLLQIKTGEEFLKEYMRMVTNSNITHRNAKNLPAHQPRVAGTENGS